MFIKPNGKDCLLIEGPCSCGAWHDKAEVPADGGEAFRRWRGNVFTTDPPSSPPPPDARVWQPGFLAFIPRERLAGAQWLPCVEPADPFAEPQPSLRSRIEALPDLVLGSGRVIGGAVDRGAVLALLDEVLG